MDTNQQKKKLGLWTSTSLVMGNMIGSGVFLLPAALAAYGGISVIGWIFSATGAFLLAKVFSDYSKRLPGAGGPYAYTRDGFGEFAGFLVAWGYWISIWVGNAAISVSFVGSLTAFFPAIKTNSLLAVSIGLSAIWLLTWLNQRGIEKAGKFQLVSTILKLLPLVVIGLGGFFFIDFSHFQPFNLSEQSSTSAITSTATLTLWAFLGLECATVPADDVEDPTKTIPRATLLGTLGATAIYMICCTSVLGMIPPAILADSSAPFADAASIMLGEQAEYLVAFGMAIGTLGALNGWITMQGQVPMAIARDKMFPAVFARKNKAGSPAIGLFISSLLVSVLMTMNYHKSLVEQFEFVILLSTLTVLVPYLFTSGAFLFLLLKEEKLRPLKLLMTFGAFAFSLWAVAGSGEETVYWGFILLMAGLPVFALMKARNLKNPKNGG